MKKTIIKLSFLLIAASCLASSAQAFVTADVAEAAARVTATIGDGLRSAEKELDKIEQKIYGERVGAGHQELKSFLGSVKGWKTDFAEQRLKMGDPARKIVPDNTQIISKVEEQLAALSVTSALSAEEQKAMLDVYQKTFKTKLDAYTQNHEKLQLLITQDPTKSELYQKSMQEIEDNIKLLNSEYEGYKRELKSKTALKNKDIEAEIKDKKWRLERLKEQLADKVKEKTSVDLKDPTKALEASLKKNFIPKEEPENPENVDKIRRRRLLERRNAYLSGYADSVMLKQRISPDIEILDDFATKTNNMDTMGGVIGADTQLKIKSIETMMQYAELLVSQLRVQVANEYGNLRFYKIKNPDKDVKYFTLDDYGFNCGG